MAHMLPVRKRISASEMTYIVSGGALNSTHYSGNGSLIRQFC